MYQMGMSLFFSFSFYVERSINSGPQLSQQLVSTMLLNPLLELVSFIFHSYIEKKCNLLKIFLNIVSNHLKQIFGTVYISHFFLLPMYYLYLLLWGESMRKNSMPITDDQQICKKSFPHKNTSASPARNPCHVIM